MSENDCRCRSLGYSMLLLGASVPWVGAAKVIPDAVVPPHSFASILALRQNWEIGYPWGTDHNGTARMERARLSLKNGVLTIRAVRLRAEAGRSSKPPHLPIRYASAAIHMRSTITVDDRYPRWEVEGEFRAPPMRGSWPAFWLTPVKEWPPEIDIVEFKGDATNWFNTFRTPTDVSTKRVAIADTGRWHRYRAVLRRIDERDAEVAYFLDGALVALHRAQFTGRSLHLIINLQMEGASGMPGPAAAVFQARRIRVTRHRAG